MSAGYGLQIVKRNRKANIKHVGVRLGRVCIRRDYSVSEVMAALKVSRQTVYNWFSGVSAPQERHVVAIDKLLTKLKRT